MERTPVDSSVLASVGYDRDRMVLEIEVAGGAIYRYFDVPESTFRQLMGAESLGKYYNANIRSGYRHERS